MCSEIEQACTNFREAVYRCVQKKNRRVLILQRLCIGVFRNKTGLYLFYRGCIKVCSEIEQACTNFTETV